ncbi:Aldolase-type TIM barrel [Penicillium canariense]|uniref:Aldolase-type TIM barrel n=1 Tax=Penicillium canariense TaxID=189055 RepID=A0A9W9IF69_9EURO|nr:Aldolase-type TIM barrel [Penicillium canariense]KAJ5175227.1 Aldolase-type TIM barrel [Penicillium canariense]
MQANTRNTASTLPIIGPSQHRKIRQATFIRPAQMSLFARVTCYPPLGQVTSLQRAHKACQSEEDDTVRFTVVIESSTSLPTQSWEAQIWHNITSSEWTALPLQKCDSSRAPLLNGSDAEYNYYRYVFSEEIQIPDSGGHTQFTVRFRTSPDTEWQWANQQHPTSNGELVFSPRASDVGKPRWSDSSSVNARRELAKHIDNLSLEVQVASRISEAPGSLLWEIRGDVDPAQGGASGIKRFTLGTPSSMIRYFSLVRIWSPWLGPRHGKDKFRLAEDAILCSFLQKDGTNLVLLAVSGINDVLTVFQSGDDGEMVVKVRSDNAEVAEFHILAAAAKDFEVAMSAVIYESRKVVKPFDALAHPSVEEPPASPPGDDVVVLERDPKIQWLADWFDGLTYCTWNGLGQDLNEEKIIHALDTLKAHGINIVNLIIDDNWQSLDNEGQSQFKRRWKQFEANPKAFPRGLKQTVETIRRSHPNIGHIAVWHALLGYWGGISPDGDLAQRYKTKQVKIKDPAAGGPIAHEVPDGKILAIDPDDVQQFYDDFYSYLTSIGVDSVKADAQFFLDLLEDPEDRKRFMTSYQDAWSIAMLKHFSSRAISCMSLIPQMIFHSQLPPNKPAVPLRNSDDFFPEIPASHPWHVFCNAHNALLTRYLNVLPDWDMFQTSHPYASFHAAARCVSGGPVYITDEPGKHDLTVIDQMTAPTVQGNTVILRPSVIGRTIDIYHDYNEGHVLRVGSYTGWAKTGSGLLGLFNIHSAQASCMVSLTDFPGIYDDADGQYIIRAHTSGKVTGLMQPLAQDSLVSVILEEKGWEILTAYPTRPFRLRGGGGSNPPGEAFTHVAILGLLGKMTGAAAVVSSDISMTENGRLRFDVHLKALGTLGIYISDLQDRGIADNFMVMILGQPVPQKTVWKEGGENANVLAIDVLAAWKAMKLDSGWSNEAFVQIFVS